MKYLLDTNIVSYAMNGRYPNVMKHMLSISPENIFIPSIVIGEIEYGAARGGWGEKTRQHMRNILVNYDVLPFTEADAVLFGKLRAELESVGCVIGLLDFMIGVQGISNNLIVVTHNTKDFIRIPSIQLEDWT